MEDDWFDGDGDEDDDFSEREYHFEQEIIRREVLEPMHLIIEAQVSAGCTEDEQADLYTFVQFWHVLDPKHRYHFFIDTGEPETVINALERRFSDGQFHAVRNFIKKKGKTIRDPLEFRLQLDAELGTVSSVGLGFSNDDDLDF